MGHMQICTLTQTHNHSSIPALKFFTVRMPFLLPNQQCQMTITTIKIIKKLLNSLKWCNLTDVTRLPSLGSIKMYDMCVPKECIAKRNVRHCQQFRHCSKRMQLKRCHQPLKSCSCCFDDDCCCCWVFCSFFFAVSEMSSAASNVRFLHSTINCSWYCHCDTAVLRIVPLMNTDTVSGGCKPSDHVYL